MQAFALHHQIKEKLMDFKRAEAKITIAKLIDLAYSKDKGLTAKIMAKTGNAQLSVDQNGNATLSGSAGILTFSGTPVLEKEIGRASCRERATVRGAYG